MNRYPKRIVCLTEETTELLYKLNEQDRIVGISGFTVRPPEARKEKPKVSAFTDANIEEILSLKPDLVIGFSDIQANIAKELITRGVTVWVNNHRNVEEIFNMLQQLGALVGKAEMTNLLIQNIENRIEEIKNLTTNWKKKPKVYFEEWYEPLISGISWVSEILEIAGGIDVFSDISKASLAKDRIITSDDVLNKNPDIILVSWCGKMFKKDKMLIRENWDQITAVRNNDIYEIDSSIILQPGLASLTDGLEMIFSILKKWSDKEKIYK